MGFKKANAALAMLTFLTGIVHIGSVVFMYVMGWYYATFLHVTAGIFMTLTMLHAILGIIAITALGDGMKRDPYKKQNMNTIIQRTSGILMFPLMFLHANTFELLTKNIISNNMIVFGLLLAVQIIFFADVLTHISLSVSRALITLGFITSCERRDKVDRVVYILCGCMFVAAAVAVTRFDIKLIDMIRNV